MSGPVSIIRSAKRIGIDLAQTCVLGDRVLAIAANGYLFEFSDGRWRRMVPMRTFNGNRRRRIRYAGHWDSARGLMP